MSDVFAEEIATLEVEQAAQDLHDLNEEVWRLKEEIDDLRLVIVDQALQIADFRQLDLDTVRRLSRPCDNAPHPGVARQQTKEGVG